MTHPLLPNTLDFFSPTVHSPIMEQLAPKFLNFAWPVPPVPTVAEQCGHFAKTADPSPWSTPINTFSHPTADSSTSISTCNFSANSTGFNPPHQLTNFRTGILVIIFYCVLLVFRFLISHTVSDIASLGGPSTNTYST